MKRSVSLPIILIILVIASNQTGCTGSNPKNIDFNRKGLPEEYEFVEIWPKMKEEPRYFGNPFGIAVDSEGNVYVSDQIVSNNSTNLHVWKLNSDGKTLSKWGGNEKNRIVENPLTNGIEVDRFGNVYVADMGHIMKFTSGGKLITKWEKHLKGKGRFAPFTSIATDSVGNVYSIEMLNDRIQKYTSDGKFITQWGGDEKTIFLGIALDSKDNVYVCDLDNSRIQKFTSEGKLITEWSSEGSDDGQLKKPTGVTVDSLDNVYVIDSGNGRIQKFTSEGKFISKFKISSRGGAQEGVTDITVDLLGNIYLADYMDNRIMKFTSKGKLISEWGAGIGKGKVRMFAPCDIVIDSSDNVYVLQDFDHNYTNDCILKFNSDGEFIASWGSEGKKDGQISVCAYGIGIDKDGNVYVADLSRRIHKFTSEGKFVFKFGEEGIKPGQFDGCIRDVAVDSKGNIYATDSTFIQKFSPKGEFIARWGRYVDFAHEEEEAVCKGDDEFKFPSSIAIDGSDNIYVADERNDRIKILNSDGKFITKWTCYDLFIAVDKTGNVYSTFHYQFSKHSPDGKLLAEWSSIIDGGSGKGEFRGAAGLAVDSKGYVYVADWGNSRIQIFRLKKEVNSEKEKPE